MLCPKCGTLLAIGQTATQVEGDNDPDTETRVYTVQQLVCRSKQCANYGQVVKTVQTQLYPTP